MTKCPKCKFYNICKGRLNETVENCVRFKSVEQTNEEWFCGLPTKEKAEAFYEIAKNDFEKLRKQFYGIANDDIDAIAMWLKEKHE